MAYIAIDIEKGIIDIGVDVLAIYAYATKLNLYDEIWVPIEGILCTNIKEPITQNLNK